MDTQHNQAQTVAQEAPDFERRPYTAPQMDSVSGPMATLLGSACSSCAVCNNPDDPLFQT